LVRSRSSLSRRLSKSPWGRHGSGLAHWHGVASTRWHHLRPAPSPRSPYLAAPSREDAKMSLVDAFKDHPEAVAWLEVLLRGLDENTKPHAQGIPELLRH